MKRITPFLWFDTQAEEAMNFYTSIFANSKITSAQRSPGGGHTEPGSFLIGTFELDGQAFYALNAGPMFKFNPAVSFFVECANQEEVDYYWDKLIEGGEPSQCGWLTDKFGLSWQIVPVQLGQFMSDPDPEKAGRAFQAMMGMVKIDIAGLQAAFDGA